MTHRFDGNIELFSFVRHGIYVSKIYISTILYNQKQNELTCINMVKKCQSK